MDDNTMLLRQVNPSWIQNGNVTSQVFKPTPKDQKKLTVDNGDVIAPNDAWDYFTSELNFQSSGVLGVTVLEGASNNIAAIADQIPYLWHAYLDFSQFSRSQIDDAAKMLRRLAMERGWLFQP